jgi:hypothetical protein
MHLPAAPAKPEKPFTSGSIQVKLCAKNVSLNPLRQKCERPSHAITCSALVIIWQWQFQAAKTA